MKTPNSGRQNNTDANRVRNDLNRRKQYEGEDIGDMGKGSGDDRNRLANEIDDNLYEEDTQMEIVDDPLYWGDHIRATFKDTQDANYKKKLVKYLRIIKKAHEWLLHSEKGAAITSMPSLRAAIGMTRKVWETAEQNSEEFLYYSDMIKDIIGARISDSGMTDSKGQIFKIFSIKNLLPDEYQDKKETTHHQRIEVIEIGGGTAKEIEQSVKESKKRLKE